MRLSRLVSLALAIVPVLSTARAQTPRSAPDSVKRPPIIVAAVRVSLRGIELSATQQAAIKAIVDKHRPALPNQANQAKPPSLALPLLSMSPLLYGEIAWEGYHPQQGGTACAMIG